MSRPKSLAERLQWMANNLSGFKEELAAITRQPLRPACLERSEASRGATRRENTPPSKTGRNEISRGLKQ